jgi:hypothetical protein
MVEVGEDCRLTSTRAAMSNRAILAISFASASLACGSGGDSQTGPLSADLRVVAGAEITDTVRARPIQALTVEVRERGRPKSGVVVRFESLPPADSTRRFELAIAVSKVALNAFGTFTSDTTNASGRASALVQFGTVAGEVRVLVTCPELGLADTATYTVRPGALRSVTLTARDTVVRAGGTYGIGAAATDRFGNRRTDQISFESRSSLATVDGTGRVTAGTEIGRGFIRVGAGTIADTAWFTVVPTMNLTFVHTGPNGYPWVADLQNDGKVVRERAQTTLSASHPVPSPTSDVLAYQHIENSISKIYLVDAAGAKRDLLSGAGFLSAYHPRFSPDGSFIYFSALNNDGYGLWRVRSDGTDLRQITSTFGYTTPGISPDGRLIAYYDPEMLVLDLSTGKKVQIGPTGWFPAFSPDGARVAYLSGSGILIANVSGSPPTRLAISYVASDAGLAWLAGGNWLLTRDTMWPMLVNANTSEVLMLRPLYALSQIAAKP